MQLYTTTLLKLAFLFIWLLLICFFFISIVALICWCLLFIFLIRCYFQWNYGKSLKNCLICWLPFYLLLLLKWLLLLLLIIMLQFENWIQLASHTIIFRFQCLYITIVCYCFYCCCFFFVCLLVILIISNAIPSSGNKSSITQWFDFQIERWKHTDTHIQKHSDGFFLFFFLIIFPQIWTLNYILHQFLFGLCSTYFLVYSRYFIYFPLFCNFLSLTLLFAWILLTFRSPNSQHHNSLLALVFFSCQIVQCFECQKRRKYRINHWFIN